MNGLEAIKYSLLFLLLITAAGLDMREMRIPNRLLRAAWVLRILLFTVEFFRTGNETLIHGIFIFIRGMLFLVGLVLFTLLSRNKLGFGDVKLLGIMALYQGVERTFTCLFYGLFMAACICLPLIVAGKVKRKDKLPMAPFFLMGYMWMFLWKYCCN